LSGDKCYSLFAVEGLDMNTDVVGRVRNVQLPTSKPLLPVFEAIMNSIQAIEDSGGSDERIEVEVLRDSGGLFAEHERSEADITGFVVRDRGIGFDDQNFQAFITSDTTFKASRGGKGIGRFMWLAAFDHAEVESVFLADGRPRSRKFTFHARGSGIEDAVCIDAPGAEPSTVVRLVGFREKYQKQCPKRLETIAAYIVEEFLDYFIGPDIPLIILRDGLTGETITLGDFFEEQMASKITKEEFTIKGGRFEVLHVRLYSTHINEHRLYLCAHGRAVLREKLAGRIPNLAHHLRDGADAEFIYEAYVNSPVLDGAVNSDRTSFNLPEDETGLPFAEMSLSQIREGVIEACKSFLAPYTAPIAEKKRARVEEFVHRDGAMYRPILGKLEDAIAKIDPEATDDEIDRRLYEGYHDLQVKLRDEGQVLLEAPVPSDADLQDFEERFDRYFEEISEVNRADLARYVCHRKAIIEFMQKQLSIQEDGKYRREDRIHSIIFPRGKTSNEVLFEDHNLWLVDERLAFHLFLSSDKPIRQLKVLENSSRKEPDIVAFDKAFAFSEVPQVPFSSITIIEFKKPQRNDYNEAENPFTQVAKYINDIREGKASTASGRPIPISPNLPFYCYIICDITPTLKEWARLFELQDTPDCLGFFGYKRAYNAYFEAISYSKLVVDAEKRNKVFFQKLGL
jgi:hypothetical protein